jgi:hypothetical protein
MEAAMINILLFQFEGTLVDNDGNARPHVLEALKTMSGFQNENRQRLAMCLLSTATISKQGDIKQTFLQVVAVLDKLGCRQFFEPVDKKITLVAQAGDQIDQRLFELSVSRSGTSAALNECVFFTADRQTAIAARNLSMTTLLYDRSATNEFSFADWSEAPLLLARILDAPQSKNTEAALRMHLTTGQSMDLVSLAATPDPSTWRAKVNAWHPIMSQKLGELNGINVQLPAAVNVKLGNSGKVKAVDQTDPSPGDVAEATNFVESLVAHGQVSLEDDPTKTHVAYTGDQGERYLHRKRFTAV